MKKYSDLLILARNTIKSNLLGQKVEVSSEIKNKYSKAQACFVTLTENSELRGCIGSLEAHFPLWKDIIENSQNAAFFDPRFNPVKQNELDTIKIEISILSKPKKLGIGKEVYEKITNQMGIILSNRSHYSTFLPQVWKQIPSKKQFLEQLSLKAGLDKDDWKESEISFYLVESVFE